MEEAVTLFEQWRELVPPNTIIFSNLIKGVGKARSWCLNFIRGCQQSSEMHRLCRAGGCGAGAGHASWMRFSFDFVQCWGPYRLRYEQSCGICSWSFCFTLLYPGTHALETCSSDRYSQLRAEGLKMNLVAYSTLIDAQAVVLSELQKSMSISRERSRHELARLKRHTPFCKR